MGDPFRMIQMDHTHMYSEMDHMYSETDHTHMYSEMDHMYSQMDHTYVDIYV